MRSCHVSCCEKSSSAAIDKLLSLYSVGLNPLMSPEIQNQAKSQIDSLCESNMQLVPLASTELEARSEKVKTLCTKDSELTFAQIRVKQKILELHRAVTKGCCKPQDNRPMKEDQFVRMLLSVIGAPAESVDKLIKEFGVNVLAEIPATLRESDGKYSVAEKDCFNLTLSTQMERTYFQSDATGVCHAIQECLNICQLRIDLEGLLQQNEPPSIALLESFYCEHVQGALLRSLSAYGMVMIESLLLHLDRRDNGQKRIMRYLIDGIFEDTFRAAGGTESFDLYTADFMASLEKGGRTAEERELLLCFKTLRKIVEIRRDGKSSFYAIYLPLVQRYLKVLKLDRYKETPMPSAYVELSGLRGQAAA